MTHFNGLLDFIQLSHLDFHEPLNVGLAHVGNVVKRENRLQDCSGSLRGQLLKRSFQHELSQGVVGILHDVTGPGIKHSSVSVFAVGIDLVQWDVDTVEDRQRVSTNGRVGHKRLDGLSIA